jgi:hypothetical protein
MAGLVMFECFLAPGSSGEDILTEQTIRDTHAQVLTDTDAEKVGFGGLPENTTGAERRLIVCRNGSDSRRIHQALEACPQVAAFRVHEVDG